MNLYYSDEFVRLYNCDNEKVDFIDYDILITDPPYGMNYQSNRRASRHSKIQGDDKFPIERIDKYIDNAKNAAYVFCRWNNLTELRTPKSLIAWIKNNGGSGDLKHEHSRYWEAICFYPKLGHEFIKRPPDIIRCNKVPSNLHPTEKPLGVLEFLICANKGDVIFDPYAGSGSTLIAAKMNNRSAVGIEIEEKYCEIAARRLEQNYLF